MALEITIEAKKIYKYFNIKKKREIIKACDDVSLSIHKGKTVGLVGESGCGKTTVGRILLRLIDPDSGDVFYRGKDLIRMEEKQIRPLRKNFQMIFQDSKSAFHPRMKAYDTLKESLRLHNSLKPKELKETIHELISRVNLSRGILYNFVGNLSGGELKRLDIARVLSIDPEIIIADEPLSLLDISIQSQIVDLLLDVQQRENTSILFISHDLRMVEMLSDTVAVMYRGKIVEKARKSVIRAHPLHPYTRHLWNPQNFNLSVRLPEGGCIYKNSCLLHQQKGFPVLCSKEQPELREHGKDHSVACHFAEQHAG